MVSIFISFIIPNPKYYTPVLLDKSNHKLNMVNFKDRESSTVYTLYVYISHDIYIFLYILDVVHIYISYDILRYLYIVLYFLCIFLYRTLYIVRYFFCIFLYRTSYISYDIFSTYFSTYFSISYNIFSKLTTSNDYERIQ